MISLFREYLLVYVEGDFLFPGLVMNPRCCNINRFRRMSGHAREIEQRSCRLVYSRINGYLVSNRHKLHPNARHLH